VVIVVAGIYLQPGTVDALTQNEYVSQSSGAGGRVEGMA
jgi:hypothetical protein